MADHGVDEGYKGVQSTRGWDGILACFTGGSRRSSEEFGLGEAAFRRAFLEVSEAFFYLPLDCNAPERLFLPYSCLFYVHVPS